MSFLLDANALIAMGWPPHEHHALIVRWFSANASSGWATTPFTQAAFVRVLAQPAVTGRPLGIDEIGDVLLRNVSHPAHRLLPQDFGLEQVLGCCTGQLHGPRQITDAYLLTTAIRNRVKLVTFDGAISCLLATPEERRTHILTLVPDAPAT